MESTQEQHLKTFKSAFTAWLVKERCKTIHLFIQAIELYIVILPVLFHSCNGVAVLTHEFTL